MRRGVREWPIDFWAHTNRYMLIARVHRQSLQKTEEILKEAFSCDLLANPMSDILACHMRNIHGKARE